MKKPLTSFGRAKSKYYYDYTRNMSIEQIKEMESKNLLPSECCGEKCKCEKREYKKSFFNIFKDGNDWNEKTIVGFIALLVMVIVMIVDLVTGMFGKDLVVKEFIYDSFTIIVLGSFGIAGLEKFSKK
tara:strand:+ start:103 stop:486 length:384 start_codon:yes stop_codon:yes gene_type:complete